LTWGAPLPKGTRYEAVHVAALFYSDDQGMNDEADLSAEQSGARAPARFPVADGDSGRPQRDSRSPQSRPQEAVGVTTLRVRRDFLAANAGKRAPMPGFVLLVRNREDGDPLMRIGYTVTKKIGNAVVRNRMKRRLRALAHCGQTVLSGTTSDLVVDRLPADAWLTDLGIHPLGDLLRPERVAQLCHTNLRNEFPPLRIPKAVSSRILPARLTTFVGRRAEIDELLPIVTNNRLVTLTGAGGIGKTRLAVESAAQLIAGFTDGACYVDLAPITDPLVVPVTVARTRYVSP